MKKFFIILAILFAIGGVVYAGYYFSSKKTIPAAVPPGTLPSTAGTLPEATTTVGAGTTTGTPSKEPVGVGGVTAGLSLVSAEEFSSFAIATSGAILGVSPDGKIFLVNQIGDYSLLSASPIDNFSSGSFSSDNGKLLVSWGYAENRQFSSFDIGTKSWQPLPLGTVSAAWKPGSHTLAYLQDKNGVKTLFSWDIDKPKTKPLSLLQLYAEDMTVGYSSKDNIILSGKSSGLVRSSLLSYDPIKKVLSPVVSEVFGLSALWNKAGTESLIFSGNTAGAGGSLRVADASGKIIDQLQFVTLPKKCLFFSDVFAAPAVISTSTKTVALPPLENFLYCAIPRDQGGLAKNLLPDNYEKGGLFTADDVYRINMEDGLISTLFDDQNKSLDMVAPSISSTTLFFINRYDRNLYALPIPRK